MVDNVKAGEETKRYQNSKISVYLITEIIEEGKNRKMGYMNICVRGLVIGILGLLCSVVTSDPTTTVMSVLCNSGVYTKGDPFAISLSYVLADLEAGAPNQKGYDYHNVSPYPNAFAYGHAACNHNLTSSDCSTCLGAAKTAMFGTCETRIGARAVLYDCTIRYEQYPFDD